MTIKPAMFRVEGMPELVEAINANTLAIQLQDNTFPESLSIKELAVSQGLESSVLDLLKSGTAEMKLLYGEGGVAYPDELQPAMGLDASANYFRYEQLRLGSSLMSVDFALEGIEQITTTALADYNTANGTTYGTDPSKIEEYLMISLKTLPGMKRGIEHSQIDHLWTTSTGEEIEWLEPMKAIALSDSQLINLEYDKRERYDDSDDRYPTIFGDNGSTWDVSIEFSGMIRAYVPEAEEAMEPAEAVS